MKRYSVLTKLAIFVISSVLLVVTPEAGAQDAPTIPADYTGKPCSGTPQAIPGTIIAINYDVAPDDKPDIAYSWSGKYTKSSFRKGVDAMGIGGFDKSHMTTEGKPMPLDGGYLGWTVKDEWAKYTVTVAETATYVVGGQFAQGGKDSKISLSFGPNLTTGPMAIPTTTGFQPGVEVYHVWITVDKLAEITLPAGTYVMTMKLENVTGLNVNNFTFTKKE